MLLLFILQIEKIGDEVRKFLRLMRQDVQFSLPHEPEELSHFIAYFLDLQDEKKQHFLELTSTVQRLEGEIEALRREVPVMRQMLSMSSRYRPSDPDRSILN